MSRRRAEDEKKIFENHSKKRRMLSKSKNLGQIRFGHGPLLNYFEFLFFHMTLAGELKQSVTWKIMKRKRKRKKRVKKEVEEEGEEDKEQVEEEEEKE